MFESLASAITASDCDEVDQARAENYMKVAAAIRNEVPTRKNSTVKPVPLTESLKYQLSAWGIKSELDIHALRCGAALSFGDQMVYLKGGYLVEKTKASYCRARNCNAELTPDDKAFGNEGLCLACTAKLIGTAAIKQRRDDAEQRQKAERKQENDALLGRLKVALINRGCMGRYHDDDFEREDDYRSWLYYRESSHEERELQRKQARSNEKQTSNNPEPVIPPVDWPVSDVFRDYPEHQARVAAAEKKYFESRKAPNAEDESDSH